MARTHRGSLSIDGSTDYDAPFWFIISILRQRQLQVLLALLRREAANDLPNAGDAAEGRCLRRLYRRVLVPDQDEPVANLVAVDESQEDADG